MGTSWIGHFTWKYLFFRDETIRTSAPQINKNSMEIENYIFQKAKSKVSSFHLLEDCFSLGDRAFLYLKHFVIDIWILHFLNHVSWYTYARRTNKMHTLFINDWIQLYCLRHVSNDWVFIIRKTVQAALPYFIMHLYKQSSHCQDVFDTDAVSNTSWQTAYIDAW